MNKHRYQRLESNNIRILLLHPSQDPSAPLRCSVKQHELGIRVEHYECISYTWGGQIRAHLLLCDDGSNFEVTANLHLALSRLRSNFKIRYLWADAVCINQNDSDEKSQQIALMPLIYRNASRVLVWLGSGIDGESEAMDLLARPWLLPDQVSFDSRLEGPQSSETQERMRKFFRLPWFSRRWVVQEVVLNPDVVFHCGVSEISWPRLHLAIKSLPDSIWNDTSGLKVRNSLHKLGDLWRSWSYLDQTVINCELFELLDSFHHLKCQEVKDRIYALAGLASDVQTSTKLMPLTVNHRKITLVPDYSLADERCFARLQYINCNPVEHSRLWHMLEHCDLKMDLEHSHLGYPISDNQNFGPYCYKSRILDISL